MFLEVSTSMRDKTGSSEHSKNGHDEIHLFNKYLWRSDSAQTLFQVVCSKREGREHRPSCLRVDEGDGGSLGSFLLVTEVVCDSYQ